MSLFRRARNTLGRFKADLRTPLPHAAGLGLGARLRARFSYLGRRYGWKILAVIAAYYLVRDSILYLIIPYLVARQILD